jgi:hypothetical protein
VLSLLRITWPGVDTVGRHWWSAAAPPGRLAAAGLGVASTI